ncbi:hypothetical protein Plec18170_005153 [Paecilomyces lecythidis]
MSKRSRRDSISSSLSDQSTEVLSPSSRAPSTPPPSKLPQLDLTSDNDDNNTHLQSSTDVMRCSLPPHKETLSFASYYEYEVHYVQAHVNRCSECGKNFPTELFLNLHIEENHDPLVAARRERGEKTTYNFYIVNDGIDKQNSMLRSAANTHRRRISAPTSPQEGRLRRRKASLTYSAGAPRVEDQSQVHDRAQNQSVPSSSGTAAAEVEMMDLEKSMAALRFVPASVTRNRAKGNR